MSGSRGAPGYLVDKPTAGGYGREIRQTVVAMNILLVNSNSSFLSAVNESLKAPALNFIECKDDVSLAHDAVQKHGIQMAMINATQGEFDVVAVCRNIRKLRQARYCYILLIATRDRQAAIDAALAVGADDFLLKPFTPGELASRFAVAQRRIKMVRDLSSAQKKIIKLAKEDPLTSLLNRRALLDAALREMGRASREMKFIASLMTTITNFKKITDSHGIDIADEVLAEFGQRMKASCRPYDEVGRYNITEFLLVLPGAGHKQARVVADRVLKTVLHKPFFVKGTKIDVAVAIGIAELNPREIAQNNRVDGHLLNDLILDALIKRSEEAMQKAERTGRNTIAVQTGL